MLWKLFVSQNFPEKQEGPSPGGGQLLVMRIFPLLHEYKNMQLSP